jgi:hypothetical protein
MNAPSFQQRHIPGHEGNYAVTNDGRVLSLPRRDPLGRQIGGLVLKPFIRKSGHCHVSLRRDGATEGHFVHRLVAEAFIGPAPSSAHVVNHLDFNPRNNAAGNLEWTTQGDNVRYSTAAGRTNGLHGSRIAAAKLTEQSVALIRAELTNRGYGEIAAVARRYGVSRSVVSNIANRKAWLHVA